MSSAPPATGINRFFQRSTSSSILSTETSRSFHSESDLDSPQVLATASEITSSTPASACSQTKRRSPSTVRPLKSHKRARKNAGDNVSIDDRVKDRDLSFTLPGVSGRIVKEAIYIPLSQIISIYSLLSLSSYVSTIFL